MIWRKLAISLGILAALIAGLAVVTLWRGDVRARAAEAAFPPVGQIMLINQRRVHVLVRGKGPDLILIHGASGNLRDFLPLIDVLAADYRVIAFDRPGMGYSDDLGDDSASLRAQAEQLGAAARQLGVKSPILLGQSYGGAVTLAWAAYGVTPAPSALVLVSAAALPWPGKLDPWYQLTAYPLAAAVVVPLAAAFAPEWLIEAALPPIFAPDPVPQGYGDLIGTELSVRRRSLAVNARQVNALRDQIVAMAPLYPALTLPVELIHGDADTVVYLQIHSDPLSHILPNSHLTVIANAGHMPHHAHQAVILAAIERARLHASR